MAKQRSPLPDAKSVRVNPSAEELKELAAKMPNARRTRYDNLNVQTEVLARSKASTFLVLDDPDASSQQAITREEGERIARLQDEYIAGCEMIPTDSGDKVGLIVGLSGTGKTTTTFTRQNGSLPVQDDFVAMMPGGKVYATEAGCFAKTFALSKDDEPTIYGAVTRPEAYLENVSQDDDGKLDFFDTSYTQNGRATFSFSSIEAGDARQLECAHFLLILNRNENIIPAVAKLNAEQAAAYFMLGETQGTSAGGAEEAGKFLRVPGTNPFWPDDHDHQGNRFLELMADHQLEVYLLNTGRVGGPDEDDRSLKVKIPHSSAIVKGIAEGTIEWEQDPDFGYEVATSVPGIDASDSGILRPRERYEQQGRKEEYEKVVARLKSERVEYLRKYPALSDEIVDAVR